MNIINSLKNNVEKYPTKVGFIDERETFTFEEIYEQVRKFSSSDLFLNNKAVIALISDNSLSFIIAYLGIINLGKTVHLIPPNISEKNFSNQLESSDPGIIICPDNTKKNFKNYNLKKIPIFEFNEIMSNRIDDKKDGKINEVAYLNQKVFQLLMTW